MVQFHNRPNVADIRAMKARGEKISMLTAYDYSMAKIVDASGIDIILVGDSASNVMAGQTFGAVAKVNPVKSESAGSCCGTQTAEPEKLVVVKKGAIIPDGTEV